MQKRDLDINYGNTNEEEIKEGYTFILPNSNYKNVNINYKFNNNSEKKDKDKENKDKKNTK